MSKNDIHKKAMELRAMANKCQSSKDAAILYEKAARMFEMVSFEEAIEAYGWAGDQYRESGNKKKAIECYLAAGKLAMRDNVLLAIAFFEEAAKLGSIEGLDNAIMLLRTELITRRPILASEHIEVANLKNTLAHLLLIKKDISGAKETFLSASYNAIKGNYPFFAGLLCIKAAELAHGEEQRKIASLAYHYFSQGAAQEKNRDYEWFAKNVCMQAVASVLAGTNSEQIISQCKKAALLAEKHAVFSDNKRLFRCIVAILQKEEIKNCPISVVLEYIKKYLSRRPG